MKHLTTPFTKEDLKDLKSGDNVTISGVIYTARDAGHARLVEDYKAMRKDRIKKCDIIAYEDLGAEAFRRLEVEDFPATVIIDSNGNNLYEEGVEEYLKWKEK